MFHIRARGLPFEDLEFLSERLIRQLADITKISASALSLEYEKSIYLGVAGASSSFPYFEISWVNTDHDLKPTIAASIEELVRTVVEPQQEIVVVFHEIDPQNYFKNGKHV
ncbi:DUF1904 family protein [Marinomonas balearica]|uniref:Phenylpyruvate tautomerase PptA (4-oxalocrotonate tautomerase family) n=1 Tax=Marinomonas balearica TaxID=491947 RepID=A0A4R6M9U8_9GAMM|nr:DUF1904 family protein [Marinomonas balearica]TDO97996.1 phenylpyruvate tautomerase PptA (4-oxalocrotonate tautomerase family) [Marinomonas balearica]